MIPGYVRTSINIFIGVGSCSQLKWRERAERSRTLPFDHHSLWSGGKGHKGRVFLSPFWKLEGPYMQFFLIIRLLKIFVISPNTKYLAPAKLMAFVIKSLTGLIIVIVIIINYRCTTYPRSRNIAVIKPLIQLCGCVVLVKNNNTDYTKRQYLLFATLWK